MRWIVVLAVFLVFPQCPLVGQNPEPDQETVGQPSQAQDPDTAPSKRAPVREVNQPPKEDAGCDEGEENRQSDLCAQWKAADAAQASAEYSSWTLLVSAIGTVLLIWTLYETRAVSRRELRAYVSVKVTNLRFGPVGTRGVNVAFDTVAHNGGVTPAYNSVHFAHAVISTPEEAKKRLSEVKNIEKSGLEGGTVIHSNEDFFSEYGKPYFLTRAEIGEIVSGKKNFYVFGVTSYVDTFNRRRRTDFCYFGGEDVFRSILAEPPKPDTPEPMKWQIAPFHNTAT